MGFKCYFSLNYSKMFVVKTPSPDIVSHRYLMYRTSMNTCTYKLGSFNYKVLLHSGGEVFKDANL